MDLHPSPLPADSCIRRLPASLVEVALEVWRAGRARASTEAGVAAGAAGCRAAAGRVGVGLGTDGAGADALAVLAALVLGTRVGARSSVSTFTHAPAQRRWLPGHCLSHVPLLQTRPSPHTLPHDPQFWRSLPVSVQTPAQQRVPPVVQAVPQLPQWPLPCCRSTLTGRGSDRS